MKHTLHLIAFVTIFSLVQNNGFAQQRRGPTLAFGGQIVQPLGDFALQYDGYPAGLAGTFSSPLAHSPLELGVGYAWNNMGSQDEDIDALISTDSLGDDIYAHGTMRIRSNINRYQVFARFRPFAGRIQPYVDAFTGMEVYKTKTDITLDNDGYSSATNDVRQHMDMSYMYGWAVGLRLRMAPNIFVEGRFENITGGPVTYVDQSTIKLGGNNDISFDTKESRTNKYTYQLGLAITF